MTLTELQQRYASHPNTEAALSILKRPDVRHLYLDGLHASAAPLFFASLFTKSQGSALFILGDLEEAGYFYHDLCQTLGTEQVLFFPSSFLVFLKLCRPCRISQPVIASAAVGSPRNKPFSMITSYQNPAPSSPRDFQTPMRHQRNTDTSDSTMAMSSFGVPVRYFSTDPMRLRIKATASIPDEIMKIPSMIVILSGKTHAYRFDTGLGYH